ncbi:MAG: hypothetical protein ACRC35_06825 [Angustibacter sp.]
MPPADDRRAPGLLARAPGARRAAAAWQDASAAQPTGAGPVPPVRRAVLVSTRPVRRSWWRRPGWPLSVMLVPFPLWWALGMSELICMLMTVPMAAYLLRRRRVEVPRGFGLWILFLLWVLVGVLVLQVGAFGAAPDQSTTRYLTWTYRVAWYLTITISFLYVLNTRAELTARRISRIVSALFLTVVAGGLLGVLAPMFEFSSLLELMLPQSITRVPFVERMIHPSAAQLQDVLGFESPRPSAPYTFTNTWGLNFVCTLPFFLYAWCGRDAGRRRYLAPVVLLAAAVPAVFSINRGMWATIVVLALFVAVRSALTGRPGMLAGVVAGGAALVTLVAVTSLGSLVTTRLTSEGSEQGRTNLGTLAVVSVTRTSPVIGLGSTRNVQGNFNTIAGGATANCPRCSPPALGTQGQVWSVVFGQGLVGLALYLTFFISMGWRFLRLRSPTVTVALTVLLASAVTMPVYNSLGTGLLVTMIGLALGVREQVAAHGPRVLTTLGAFVTPLRRCWPVVLVFAVVGTGAGLAVHENREPRVSAVTSAYLPQRPVFSFAPASDGPLTVDTLAQVLSSGQVLDAVEQAGGRRPTEGDGTLVVRAAPNTRTLNVTFTGRDKARAQAGSQAAVSALLLVRQRQLDAERRRQIDALRIRAEALNANLSRLTDLIQRPLPGTRRAPSISATTTLRARRALLQTRSRVINQQLATIVAARVSAGVTIRPPRAFVSGDRRRVDLASGLALGVGTGGVVAVAMGRRGRRIRRRQTLADEAGLPVLARLDAATALSAGDPSQLGTVVQTAALVHDFGSCVPVDDDPRLVEVAAAIGRSPAVRAGTAGRCVIVARPRTRSAAVARVAAEAVVRGQTPIGVVVASGSGKRRWTQRDEPMLGNGRVTAMEGVSGAADSR